MPEDFGKWGFLALIILIVGPLLFWIIALLINWGKWAFFEKKKVNSQFAEMIEFKNPVSSILMIDFKLGVKTQVKLNLLDKNFNAIKPLMEDELFDGAHKIELDTTKFENGEYFCQLVTDNQRITKKIVIEN